MLAVQISRLDWLDIKMFEFNDSIMNQESIDTYIECDLSASKIFKSS